MAKHSEDPLVRAYRNQVRQEQSRRRTPNKIPVIILEAPKKKKKRKKK